MNKRQPGCSGEGNCRIGSIRIQHAMTSCHLGPTSETTHEPAFTMMEGGGGGVLQRDMALAEESLLRVAADLNYYRKQFTPTAADERESSLLHDLLPIGDELEGIMNGGEENPLETRRRVGRCLQNLRGVLLDRGVKVEPTLGSPYNPESHVLQCLKSDATKLENTVIEVVECGYRRDDDVFRPAKVVVNVLDQTALQGEI